MALWIDQICIDQGSTAEKGDQVAIMGEIYRGASEVLIWLGPASLHSGWLIRKMEDLGLLAIREAYSEGTKDSYCRSVLL